jgi:hypothetical protein
MKQAVGVHNYPEDGSDMFFWNIIWLSQDCMGISPRRYNIS